MDIQRTIAKGLLPVEMWVREEMHIGATDALTTIDGNCDFTEEGGALYVKGIPGEADNDTVIQRIIQHHRLPFGYRAVTDEGHSDNHIETKMFGAHCVLGTPGQKIHPLLKEVYLAADERLMKGMSPHIISHSIATSPQFDSHIGMLRSRNIKRVFMDGWAFTHCVGDGAMSYADQWFEVYIIRDATRSVPPPYGLPEVMVEKLRIWKVKFVLSNQLVAK